MQNDWTHELSREELVALIAHGSVLDRCGAMCEIVRRKLHTGMVVGSGVEQAIEERRDDSSVFWNSYTVGDFATAALHLLRGQPYTGDREEISGLISAGLDF